MFKNNNRVDRFAIRKLTVGVASVLIGVCFLGGNVNTVSANPVGGDAQTEQPAKKDEQVKPGVETEADDKTEVGTGTDTNVGKTEQGQQDQQKIGDKKSVDNGKPVAKSDYPSDGKGGVSEGKGLDHGRDAGKDGTVPNGDSENSKNKFTDKGQSKDAQNSKNIQTAIQGEDRQTLSADHNYLTGLEDSKIKKTRKAPRVRKGGEDDDSDAKIKIPASAVPTKDDQGKDCYIDHADVERTFNMWLKYTDVQVTLDNKGLFATGYNVVNDKDFIPKKKIYTLKLRYTGDRYYDENGVTTEVKGNWIVDDYKIADPKLKNWNDVHYGYEYPKNGSEYDTSNSNYDSTLTLPSSKEIVFSIRSENPDLDETHLRELVNKKINLNQIVFPVADGKYFFTPYRIYYSTEKDENGEISYKCNEETSDPVGESSVSYLGAKADFAFKKYGIYADMSNGSESGMYIGYPHVPRPIDSKNLSINLGLTIYYYEMPKVIAIGEDGKKFKVYLHLILEESLAIPTKESMRQ